MMPCFVEIVDVVTKIASTLFAGFGAWIAYQILLKTPDQEAEPKEAELSEQEIAIPSNVIVFKTSNQTTTLKVTENGLECHLDDKRSGKSSGLQWILTKAQAKEILSTHDYRPYSSYKLYTGLFSIGPRKNWLYSKKLYPEPGLLELELERLLTKTSNITTNQFEKGDTQSAAISAPATITANQVEDGDT